MVEEAQNIMWAELEKDFGKHSIMVWGTVQFIIDVDSFNDSPGGELSVADSGHQVIGGFFQGMNDFFGRF